MENSLAQNGKNAKVEKPQSRAALLSCPASFFSSWATVGINPRVPVIYMVLKAASPTKHLWELDLHPEHLRLVSAMRKCMSIAILFFVGYIKLKLEKR